MLNAAVESLTALLPASARPDALRVELATAWEQLAILHGRTDRFGDEETAHRRAIGLFDAVAAVTTNPRVVEGVARARLALAVCLDDDHSASTTRSPCSTNSNVASRQPGSTAKPRRSERSCRRSRRSSRHPAGAHR